jgi:peroxiredoxin Q/BCP
MKLNIGDKAPVFGGKDQDGKEVNLKDYSGKKVVLYFYPNDDTPTCTVQACNLRDNYKMLLSKGYNILGISANDEKSHIKFKKKYDLPFTLIADTDKSINELYGVWVEKSMYGKTFMGTARTTFIIDEKGIITDIISKVISDSHAEQILNPGIEIKRARKEKPAPAKNLIVKKEIKSADKKKKETSGIKKQQKKNTAKKK